MTGELLDPICCYCGSESLMFGVDENDVEDGTWQCEDCGSSGRVDDPRTRPVTSDD